MRFLFRWVFRLVTGALVLAALALLLTYYFLSRSLPDYEEDYQITGLSAPVEIVRNVSNVPHIFGQNDRDVFFALGFAHAQDRLWQMMMLRRTAQGRLSEIFGARTLKIDRLIRRLDLYGAAEASLPAQDGATQEMLTAYAAGVNAWIGEVNASARGRGAPEFFLFPSEIAPWREADSLALIKLMALQLSAHVQDEVLRAQLSLTLPPERLRDVLPDDPGQGVIALPPYAALAPGALPAPRRFAVAPRDPLNPVHPPAFASASNAWAAAPKRAAAGGALLASDPHLGFSAPSTWYLARLQLRSGGVIGGTIPGMPVILIGRSDHLGWGLTSAYVDDQDLFIEALNPANPAEYRTPSGWKAFETQRAEILVQDGEPVVLDVQRSENGPILGPDEFDVGGITPEGHVMALSCTALARDDTSMTAALRLMQAQTRAEAIEAGRLFVAPAQNLTLADRQGVALQMIGRMPKRDSAHQSQGRMPTPGWIATNRWQGAFPYEMAPRVIDPPSGIIGNTNNKTIDRPFPQHLSFTWGDTQRIQRWLGLMSAREVHTRGSFIEAQLDTVSVAARTLLSLVGADLWFTGAPAPEGTPEHQRQNALRLLAEWNGEMNEHLPEPLIYAAWMRALNTRLLQDELGGLAAAFDHPDPVFIERVFRNIEGAGVWCDVVQSAPKESCTEMALLALDDALLYLREKYGPTLESWRWGDAHQAAHDHPVLGEIPFLREIVNIRQSTSGDDHTLLRGRTSGAEPEPFLNVHGAGYRGVYDFADPDSSVFIISTGQSGHPLSRFYDDMSVLWRRGEYVPMSLDPALARAAAVGVSRLEPLPAE